MFVWKTAIFLKLCQLACDLISFRFVYIQYVIRNDVPLSYMFCKVRTRNET